MQYIRSEKLRQKLLRVCDGEAGRLMYLLHHLNELREAEAVCDWLIVRGLTGKNLVEWTQEKFGGLFLPMFDHIRAQANRTGDGMPVLLGRDYGQPRIN